MGARVEGKNLLIEGRLDALSVPALFESSLAAVRGGAESVDFSRVEAADSSAVAMSLALLREAEAAGRKLSFLNAPPTMLKLARLYAVDDLFAAA